MENSKHGRAYVEEWSKTSVVNRTYLKRTQEDYYNSLMILMLFLTCSRYFIRLSSGKFDVNIPKPPGWFHVVFNFIGPNYGQGLRIYYNGDYYGVEQRLMEIESNGDADGKVVIGRAFYEQNDLYASVQVDELLFFNAALAEAEITTLSKYTTNKTFNW